MRKVTGHYVVNEHSSIQTYFELKHFFKASNLFKEGYSYEKTSELAELPIDVIIDLKKDFFFHLNSEIILR